MAANALLSADARGSLLVWDLKSYNVIQVRFSIWACLTTAEQSLRSHPGEEVLCLQLDDFAKLALTCGKDDKVQVP